MKRYFNYWPGRNSVLIMLVVILGISWYYDYPAILLKRPQSIHAWRQSDGTSLALNYYQHGMHFFKPEVHLLLYNDDGTTGYTAPSEIPVLYYFVAAVYSVFGYHDYIFRFINLLIFIIGLLYLFKLGKRVTGSDFWAGATVILLFSSPLIIYYANNFLPNSAGLALSLMGWYYFYSYYESGNTRTFLISVIFFLMAATMKITELSGPIIILFLLMADMIYKGKFKLRTDKDFFLKVLAIFAIFLCVAAWVYYAKYYNALHKSRNFSTQIFPIWNLTRDDITQVVTLVKSLWLADYYMPLTLYLTGAMTLFSLIFIKKADRILGVSMVIYLAGFVVYVLLWFAAFSHHDYFLIGFYILPVFIMLNFFRFLHQSVKGNVLNYTIKAAVVVFMLMNVAYGAKGNRLRYASAINDLPAYRDLHTITGYLRNIGIKPEDRVVFIPEICVRSLYLMNQPGWVLSFASKTDTAQEQNDSISMADFVKSGADYLITNNMASIFNRKSILPYTRQLFAQQGNIYIFKIPPVRTNFIISENPAEIFHIQCDAENADSTGADLFFDDLNYKANMGGIRSEDPVRSGKFSVLMNESHVYAFTTMIHARPLDIIKVKVFCKGDNINCNVACGCDGYETRYDSEIRADTGSTGWKCLTGSITVPSYYDSDSFKIYIYNPAGTPVYLDDFEISVERYELNKL